MRQSYFSPTGWLIALIFALVAGFLTAAPAMAQETGSVSGVVKSKASGEALVGANVTVEGTKMGAPADINGAYTISGVPAGSYKVRAIIVGYEPVTTDVVVAAGKSAACDFVLDERNIIGDMIVVTASRKAEKITEAPATISVISAASIASLPSPNVGELLARQKGVDYIRTGVFASGINVRGFNSAFNPKNLQMNDARISTLVATGLPLGPLSSTVKEDIDRIEVILGPAAALYGPNAHNGLVNTLSKDPRTSQGTVVAFGGGNQSVFTGRFRHAGVVNEQWAYKLSGGYDKGVDFDYVDTVYNATGTVAWNELDLDRNFNSLRGEASLYFSPTTESDLIFTYGGNNSNYIAQTNAGRNQIKDWQIHFLQARYVSPRFFGQAYHTISVTENTYAINQRTQNYRSFLADGFSDAVARQRSFKEAWSPTAGALKRGSVFKDNSRRWNAELQYNDEFEGFGVIAGGQWQQDIADSKGTYLLDQAGNIVFNQLGFYAQVEKPFGDTGFKAVAAARGDNHTIFGFNIIPKGALLYTSGNNTFRITYGKGIAAPTILNLSANIFGGLLLGNGEGFTLSNGTKIEKLKLETIQTIELGYKGTVGSKLYVDASAYYNISENFLSPAINIATPAGVTVTHRGDTPIQQIVPGTPAAGAGFVLTYLNFGKVKTYGTDFGINYFFTNNLSAALNYSYFGFNLDRSDLTNDANKDKKVTDTDLPINTPKHKLSIALNGTWEKFFGSIFTRWVDEYDFFSGINVAASANSTLTAGNAPTGLKENARFGRTFNYGPLGGFVNVDVSAGYKISNNVTFSAQVVNVFDSSVREFVASPFIGRLVSSELKFTF